MPRLVTDADGATWEVALSGRHTQYVRDEISLEFSRTRDGGIERRYARFSPRGAKSAERAFEQASDRLLARLLATAGPAWTAPEGGVAPGG
ncbi:MAG: hypothetical protein KC544_04445 [Gemmatimonadetes bacterium]|nr:hypothetical protein [Gemmatimonadota bacterium]MCB9518794.1 hypothetical protein [Gemmatimonadales bacterium]MCA9762362.1 hypothetical protein [Gemmatimonadota bacterium]MCA9769548.1 hypothetical protein [Gemmatimonadota bacterium]HPF60490.1 hypothetical protein [Gemmatimonadales bacterium]